MRTHPGTHTVFTIGHSNHSPDVFSNLLSEHRIDVLADVRSAPYSRFNPQFNREPLAVALKRRGIEYTYFGRELGGRPNDPACYEGGRVRYDRIAETERFRDGLIRLAGAASQHRVALMCAEKEPLDCHRTLLVARSLDARDVDVHHILADGTRETQADAMSRLLEQHNLSHQGDLLATREQFITLAVERRAARSPEREVP